MTPKDNRDHLMGEFRPFIRLFEVDDIKWILSAAKISGHEIDKEEHIKLCQEELSQFDEIWIIEDQHKQFKEGRGPVGLVTARYNGWILEPHVDWFPWATRKNMVRGFIQYLHRMRYSDLVGVMLLHADETTAKFIEKLHKYFGGSTPRKCGFIRSGHEDFDVTLYQMRGRKKANKHG